MSNPISVLIIETSKDVVRLLKDVFSMGQLNATVTQALTPSEGLQYLAEHCYDVLLFSDQFDDGQLAHITALHPDLPLVTLTKSESAAQSFRNPGQAVQEWLPVGSTDILAAARKVQLAIHKKRSELELEGAQRNIDRLADLADTAMFALDSEGRILSANRAAKSILNLDDSDLLNNSVLSWFDNTSAGLLQSLLASDSFDDKAGFTAFQIGLLQPRKAQAPKKAEAIKIEFALAYGLLSSHNTYCLIFRELTKRSTLESQIKTTLYVHNAVAHLNTVREQNLPLSDKLGHVLGVLENMPYCNSQILTGMGLLIVNDRKDLVCFGIALSEEHKQRAFALARQESHGALYFYDSQLNYYGFTLKAAGPEPLGLLLLKEKPELLNNTNTQRSTQFRLLLGTIAQMINEHFSQRKVRRLSTAIEQSPAGVIITDSDGNIQYTNEAVTAMTGYGKSEMLGKNPRLLKSGLMEEDFYTDLWSTIKQGKIWKGEVKNRRKDGITYWESMLIAPVESPDESHLNFIAIKENIDQRKQYEQQLVSLATRDALTGLPNRTLLNDRLDQALALARRYKDGLTLLLVDLDDFNTVNNQHGHQAGDELLITLATRLKQGLRESDTVGRQGGDEFLIILPRLCASGIIQAITDSIINALKLPYKLWNAQLVIPCSIGIATCLEGEISSGELHRRADLAMYKAKQTKGHSSHFFDASLGAELDLRIWFRGAISKAAANDELSIHYQPQIDIKTEAISGTEALLRWQHPEKGTISPAEFIPLAEEFGNIVDLGNWVIEEVCRQLSQWLACGYHPPRIAINLSARQLLVDNFLNSFLLNLEKYNVPAQLLEVEITESEIMQYPEQAARLLDGLRNRGISVAIDDFGTGYSSLSHLKRLPLDTLKVDRSFIDDITSDHNSRTIASTIIDLGHNLGMKILAEGVETKEQLVLLEQLGADEYQGFYYSQAVAAEEFQKRLVRHH